MDFVHGAQSFLSDDIGDFIVRRADGSAAFFFSNAVDDARDGHHPCAARRGPSHQLAAPDLDPRGTGLPVPRYGHVALLVGTDGAPLSKRHGATTVREYREQGFTAAALCNHLFRLGHSTPRHGLLDLAADGARVRSRASGPRAGAF